MTEEVKVGTKMKDGSIFAGMTADGKQQIFALPTDLSLTMTFNEAAEAVTQLNTYKVLGYDDWQIPSIENLNILQENKNEGALKGTFNTTREINRSGWQRWYWSSTKLHDELSGVYGVRFSEGLEGYGSADGSRLRCRPVRLVPIL